MSDRDWVDPAIAARIQQALDNGKRWTPFSTNIETGEQTDILFLDDGTPDEPAAYIQRTYPIDQRAYQHLAVNAELRKERGRKIDDDPATELFSVCSIPTAMWLSMHKAGMVQDDKELYRWLERNPMWKTTEARLI